MISVAPLVEPLLPVPASTERVKIGLVGLNFGRSMMGEILAAPVASTFELTAVCDKDPASLNQVVLPDDIARYQELDELLEDPNVEAIGLFTGPVGRAELVRKIIRAGRHVITTKPLEMNADAMLEVLREAQTLGRVIHCNSPGPILSQDLRIMQKWVREYDLGCPVGAHADVWASYRETADGTWYDDPARCPAAPIYRLGIYLINDLIALWGKVEQVDLLESRIFTGRPTSDNSQLSLLFENKALATIYASFCINDGNAYRNGLTLNYENGTIYRNMGPAWPGDLGGGCHLALVQNHQNKPLVVTREAVNERSGVYQWDYFARAIRGECVPQELSPEETVEGIRVMEAVRRLGTQAL